MSKNTQFYVDSFSDVRTLPSLTLRQSDGAPKLSLATPQMERLAGFDVQYPELTSIPASDGFQMPTSILKPKDFRPDRKHPVILYVYGGASGPVGR